MERANDKWVVPSKQNRKQSKGSEFNKYTEYILQMNVKYSAQFWLLCQNKVAVFDNNSLPACVCVCLLGIVHENVKMGSDGESDQASGTSSDEVQSPVRVRMRNNHHRRISNEVKEAGSHVLHTHTQIHLVLHRAYCTHTTNNPIKIGYNNYH